MTGLPSFFGLKVKACFQALSLVFIAPTSSLSRAHLHTVQLLFPSQLLVTCLLRWLCREGKANPFAIQPPVFWFVYRWRGRDEWAISHFRDGTWCQRDCGYIYSGLDLCFGVSKICLIQKSKMCLQEFITFSWPCRPNTCCFGKSETDCRRNLEEGLGFAQRI